MESKVLGELAVTYQMDEKDFLTAVKAQCFKDGVASDAQLMMLLSFARQYSLNPLAKECYAFVSGGKVNIGVQTDGWSTIANRDPSYDGQEIEYEFGDGAEPIAITSKTYVKGRAHPTVYRAAMAEWKRATDVWKQMPSHQLFLKARNQGIRFALGVSAYDPDDLERIAAPTIAVVATTVEPPAITNSPQPATPEAETVIHCLHVGCSAVAAGEFDTKVGKVHLCAEHAELHKKVKRRGRTAKVDGAGALSVGGETEGVDKSGGGKPAATEDAADSSSLEAFLRAHDVPKKRLDLALAKYGAASIAELKPDEQTAILDVFRRSYANA